MLWHACVLTTLFQTHTLSNKLALYSTQSVYPIFSFIFVTLSLLILSIVSPALLHSHLYFFFIPVVVSWIACSFSTPKCSNESWSASVSVRELNRVVLGWSSAAIPGGRENILHCVSFSDRLIFILGNAVFPHCSIIRFQDEQWSSLTVRARLVLPLCVCVWGALCLSAI